MNQILHACFILLVMMTTINATIVAFGPTLTGENFINEQLADLYSQSRFYATGEDVNALVQQQTTFIQSTEATQEPTFWTGIYSFFSGIGATISGALGSAASILGMLVVFVTAYQYVLLAILPEAIALIFIYTINTMQLIGIMQLFLKFVSIIRGGGG